jgi:hypothetical protein
LAVDSTITGYANGVTRGNLSTSVDGAPGTLTIGGNTYDTNVAVTAQSDVTLSAIGGDVNLNPSGSVSVGGSGLLEATQINTTSLNATGSVDVDINLNVDGDAIVDGSVTLNGSVLKVNSSMAGVSSGPDVTLNTSYTNYTGAAIAYIRYSNWGVGTILHIRLANGVTITHNGGAAPANHAPIFLRAGSNVTTSNANQLLTLFYDGVKWFEMGPIS